MLVDEWALRMMASFRSDTCHFGTSGEFRITYLATAI